MTPAHPPIYRFPRKIQMIFIFLYKSYYYIIILAVDKSVAFIIAQKLFFPFPFFSFG